MKITKIDVFQVDLPYAGGTYTLSGGREYTSFDATIVRITADDGLEPHLLGLDPRHVDRINDAMDEALVGHTHAKTALDVACWDLFGKSVGMPVCDLLGGRTTVKMPIISSIYTGEPEEMRRRFNGYRAQGYRGHSVKVGDDPALDAARLKAVLADQRPGEFFLVVWTLC